MPLLFFFSRELLDQVAEFEKSEYTSSNKKVEFNFNQIIIKCPVESWQMYKMLSIDSLCLGENQNPTHFLQNSLWNSPKGHILHFGTKAPSEVPWLFPECLFCPSGVCLTHLIPRSARLGICGSVCFWVPSPGTRAETGTFACPSMDPRAEKISQYRYHSSLSCLNIVANLIWFVS